MVDVTCSAYDCTCSMFCMYPDCLLARFLNARLRMNHVATAMPSTPKMTAIAMPAFAPPLRPPPPPSACEAPGVFVGAAPGEPAAGLGLPPNGQKSPPSGGRIHVSPSPSVMFWKSDCRVAIWVLFQSMTNGAGTGVVSVVLQLGPRAPMKDVLPTSTLFSTVKLMAEVIAMPYPNAPVRTLLSTVPDRLTLLPYCGPNQVRGPIAMPILYRKSHSEYMRGNPDGIAHLMMTSSALAPLVSLPSALSVAKPPTIVLLRTMVFV